MAKSVNITEVSNDNSVKNLSEGAMLLNGTGNRIGGADTVLGQGATQNNYTTDFGSVEKSLGLASSSVKDALGFGNSALLFAGQSRDASNMLASDAMGTVAKMSAAQLTSSAQTIDKVGELAETFRSDGTNRDRRMLMIGGALLLVAGLGMAYYARKKSA